MSFQFGFMDTRPMAPSKRTGNKIRKSHVTIRRMINAKNKRTFVVPDNLSRKVLPGMTLIKSLLLMSMCTFLPFCLNKMTNKGFRIKAGLHGQSDKRSLF